MITRLALMIGVLSLGVVGLSMTEALSQAPVLKVEQIAAFDHLR